MGNRKRNWFSRRSKLCLHNHESEGEIPRPDPPAATEEGIAASVDLYAKRRIYLNTSPREPFIKDGRLVVEFVGNKVRTSKYSAWNFVPKNLFEQFRSLANFYFTSLVILQCFPPFMQVSPVLTAAPIVFIVLATAVKDAFEDYKRHQSDASVNKNECYVLGNWINENYAEIHSWKTALARTWKSIKKPITRQLGSFIKRLFNTLNRKPTTTTTTQPNPPTLHPKDYIPSSQHRLSTSSRIRTSLSSQPPIWKLSKWESLHVGDILLLRNDDPIPADIIILSTSEKDSICYIETKSLDGETNLKVRRGVPGLEWVKTPGDCNKIKGVVESERPSSNLFTWNGVLHLENDDTRTKTIPLNTTNLLLRGSTLRNTPFIIGLCIFTGTDTKIMLNSGKTPSKRSRIDRQINPQVMVNFMLLSAMCMICAVVAAVYAGSFIYEDAAFAGVDFDGVLGPGKPDFESPAYTAFITFFTCMILFQAIIPIALVISVEVAKLYQSFMIYLDEEMGDEGGGAGGGVNPRTWNLCDDLGQIEYVFSDKTGTLTRNEMEFRKCTINGVTYGSGFVSDAMRGEAVREGRTVDDDDGGEERRGDEERSMRRGMNELFDTKYISETLGFVDVGLVRDLAGGGLQGRRIREFFTLLAVCHTVLVEAGGGGDSEEGDKNDTRLEYKAQSPDEAALVSAARDVGFAFLRREDNQIVVDVMGQERTYTILHVLEFNSDRKRMSVIIRRPEGDIILLTKGADSVVYDRLGDGNDGELLESTQSALEGFANEGLRTLCLAYRVLSPSLYNTWSEEYSKAQNLINNRDEECDKVADKIERELVLMGATAIEDKLQTGVPETIRLMRECGMKVWVLTGDKMETAINIGFACELLERRMVLVVVKCGTREGTRDQLVEALERFWGADGTPRVDVDGVGDANESGGGNGGYALIIDGETLKFALEDGCKALFLELGCRCRVVVCCRVSPLQKAMVVRLVRKGLGAITLSIGDGANDVSMIQESDIGIGIRGKEGLQASMSSDYSVGCFRALGRLLVVHGRWSYMRTSGLVLNYFYKNVGFLGGLFWAEFDNGFSASTIVDVTYAMWFNTFFSLLPTIALGTLDMDVSDRVAFKYPQLYGIGIRQELYGMERFWGVMAEGIYQSVVVYYFTRFWFGEGVIDSQGRIGSIADFGTTVAMGIILVVNFQVAIVIQTWNILIFLGLLLTIIVWIVYVCIYASVEGNPTFGQVQNLLGSGGFWAVVVVSVVVGLGPRLILGVVRGWWWPGDERVVREIGKYGVDGIKEEVRRGSRTGRGAVEEGRGSGEDLPDRREEVVGVGSRRVSVSQGGDGFGEEGERGSGGLQPSEIEGERRRRTSSFRPRAISAAVKKVSHAVARLRTRTAGRLHRAGSLVVFMGGGDAETRDGSGGGRRHRGHRRTSSTFWRGFAFSHEGGMRGVITPGGDVIGGREVITPVRPLQPRRVDSQVQFQSEGRERNLTPVRRLVEVFRGGGGGREEGVEMVERGVVGVGELLAGVGGSFGGLGGQQAGEVERREEDVEVGSENREVGESRDDEKENQGGEGKEKDLGYGDGSAG